MSNPDMFPQDPALATPPAAPDVNQLLDLVKREDGSRKYNSVEELAKGAAHAQSYIQELQTKLKALEDGKDKSALDAILEKLQSPPVVPAAPAVSTEVPLDAVEKAVLSIEARKAAERNAASIKEALVQAAGSEQAAAKAFHDAAQSVGLSTVELSALAAKSPQAVRAILKLDKQSAPAKTGSTIVPSNVPATDPQRKRVMLGGASTSDLIAALKKHTPQ